MSYYDTCVYNYKVKSEANSMLSTANSANNERILADKLKLTSYIKIPSLTACSKINRRMWTHSTKNIKFDSIL